MGREGKGEEDPHFFFDNSSTGWVVKKMLADILNDTN